MKIQKIALTHVRIPLREPFTISNGSVSEKDSIIVALFADGFTGYGEASPMSGSFYSDDNPETVWTEIVEKIAPFVIGAEIDNLSEISRIVDAAMCSGFARAGVETAAWDLKSRIDGKSLCELLGGKRLNVESGLAVGICPSTKVLIDTIARELKEGYKRVKIKIQKGWDVEPLKGVRREFGNFPLMVDANCAYGRRDIEYLKCLDEFDLMMIEQPLGKKDLEGHAVLQDSIKTPICLDESAASLSDVREAIRFGSCKIVNIKLQRVGGFENAKAMHDLCVDAGLEVWAGTMPELGIGGIHGLMLSTLTGFTFPADVESSERWFVDDIIVPKLRVHEGMFEVADYSEFGIDMDVVRKYKVKETVIGCT